MPRSKTAVQIVIPGVPNSLADRLTKLAKREGRSRAAQVRVLLEEIVATRERELATAA